MGFFAERVFTKRISETTEKTGTTSLFFYSTNIIDNKRQSVVQ